MRSWGSITGQGMLILSLSGEQDRVLASSLEPLPVVPPSGEVVYPKLTSPTRQASAVQCGLGSPGRHSRHGLRCPQWPACSRGTSECLKGLVVTAVRFQSQFLDTVITVAKNVVDLSRLCPSVTLTSH